MRSFSDILFGLAQGLHLRVSKEAFGEQLDGLDVGVIRALGGMGEAGGTQAVVDDNAKEDVDVRELDAVALGKFLDPG